MWTLEELQGKTRAQLQALAKERGIKANSKTVQLIADLLEWSQKNSVVPAASEPAEEKSAIEHESVKTVKGQPKTQTQTKISVAPTKSPVKRIEDQPPCPPVVDEPSDADKGWCAVRIPTRLAGEVAWGFGSWVHIFEKMSSTRTSSSSTTQSTLPPYLAPLTSILGWTCASVASHAPISAHRSTAVTSMAAARR